MIMFLELVCLLVGCRAKLDTSSSMKRQQTDVIGLELRRADSLWGSSSERLTYKIEFYAPWEIAGQACNDNQGEKYTEARQNPATPKVLGDQAAPVSTMSEALLGQSPQGGLGFGMGAVKSIEITNEKNNEVSSTTIVDSTHNEARMTQEAANDSTVAALIYLLIKSPLK
jgi:hypothetical protein